MFKSTPVQMQTYFNYSIKNKKSVKILHNFISAVYSFESMNPKMSPYVRRCYSSLYLYISLQEKLGIEKKKVEYKK